jgi:hypothetical protein
VKKPIETYDELVEIQERLHKIAGRFDVSFKVCGSCKIRHFHDLEERRAMEQVQGAIGRLEKVLSLVGERSTEEIEKEEENHG